MWASQYKQVLLQQTVQRSNLESTEKPWPYLEGPNPSPTLPLELVTLLCVRAPDRIPKRRGVTKVDDLQSRAQGIKRPVKGHTRIWGANERAGVTPRPGEAEEQQAGTRTVGDAAFSTGSRPACGEALSLSEGNTPAFS